MIWSDKGRARYDEQLRSLPYRNELTCFTQLKARIHYNRNLFHWSQNLNVVLKRLQCFPMCSALWKYCIPLSYNYKLVCDRKLDLKVTSQAATYSCRISSVWHHYTQKVITTFCTRIYIGILYWCRLVFITTCCYSYTSGAALVSRFKLKV
jgi:hypothetical protein